LANSPEDPLFVHQGRKKKNPEAGLAPGFSSTCDDLLMKKATLLS
jgi:hypothetical protein